MYRERDNLDIRQPAASRNTGNRNIDLESEGGDISCESVEDVVLQMLIL